MVLWELTLATAYVLGLKRTYRLALKSQRRILGTKYPRIKGFAERRTRAVFRVAMNVHKEIQRRDISVGRSVGNWLLRMLDRARPQANIRGACPPPSSQSGPGRPRIDSKNGQSNHAKVVLLGNPVNSSGTSLGTLVRGPIGARLRSRISGLKLRTRPVMNPLPALSTLGMLWQPLRQQSGGLYAMPSSGFPSRSFGTSLRLPQSGPGRYQGSVFREDIARLMRS